MTAVYSAARNPILPWGYWLRVVAGHNLPLLDENGDRWPSVRENFWQVRLNMPRVSDGIRDEQLELMLDVLTAAERRATMNVATSFDLMGNHDLASRSYQYWLISMGLMAISPRTDMKEMTEEGRAVVLMLLATRPLAIKDEPIGPVTHEILRKVGRVAGPGASRMAAVEAEARNKSHAFVRELHAGSPGISLVVRDGGGTVPFARTVWSAAFANEDGRDAYYIWLCDRVDRWDAWAKLAWEKGGPVLTQHLFAMLVAEVLGAD